MSSQHLADGAVGGDPGLRPARELSGVVAIMTHALLEHEDTDPFTLHTIDGLTRELATLGYGALMLPPVSDARSRALVESLQYDVVVAPGRLERFKETEQVLLERGIPWVAPDGTSGAHEPLVTHDDDAIAGIVEHLQNLGHTRIATVSLRHSLADSTPGFIDMPDIDSIEMPRARARLNGFVKAGVVPHAIYHCSQTTRIFGILAARAMLDMDEPPTAIVCQADVYAAGVLDEVRARGLRVPEDVSVTGFDGLPLTDIAPHVLTTVLQDGVEKGRMLARYAIRLAAEANPHPEVLALKLKIGTTTGPAAPAMRTF